MDQTEKAATHAINKELCDESYMSNIKKSEETIEFALQQGLEEGSRKRQVQKSTDVTESKKPKLW